MRRKRSLVKLNDLDHLMGQSTQISSVGVSDPKNNSVQTTFLISDFDQKLFTVKFDYSDFLLKVG